MPRVRPLTEEARAKEAFNHVLDVKRAESDIPNWTVVADRLGIKRNTFYTWRNNPGGIKRRDLIKLYKLLKYTPEDIFASLGFGRPT